jgi:hypothetical protein
MALPTDIELKGNCSKIILGRVLYKFLECIDSSELCLAHGTLCSIQILIGAFEKFIDVTSGRMCQGKIKSLPWKTSHLGLDC